jgi:1-deoxy-D-xylulose-5-phosphate reductoisomerase
MRRTLAILGSTGSIGTQALDVVRHHADLLEVVALSAGSRAEELLAQAREFRPRVVHLSDAQAAQRIRTPLTELGIEVLAGPEALTQLTATIEADMIIVATVGWTGLEPTLAALQAGRDIALANKEVLVCAGQLVMETARANSAQVWPLDSEHNAIAQCLAAGPAGPRAPLRRIILTCSGGPFRNTHPDVIDTAMAAQTLDHPTWSMGRKITVDSATLMNKGFEVIEAHHLFGVALDKIEVIIHPQSIIHSMVEFVDGSMIAQLGATDMRLPIQNVLTQPVRLPTPVAPLDLATVARLDFHEPDTGRFPCLAMAYEAARAGGTYPCVLNAANEVAVAAHLENQIACGDIPRVIRAVLDRHRCVASPDLGDLGEADRWARTIARAVLGDIPTPLAKTP